MAEQDSQEQTAESGKAGRGKYVFLLIAIVAFFLVWWLQRSDPALPDWSNDLEATMDTAAEQDRRVLVFFSNDPMTHDDKRAVEDVLKHPDTRLVLEHGNFLTVHLERNRDTAAAERYGIASTPAFVLLEPGGEVVRRHQGYLIPQKLCGEFLGVTIREARQAQSGG
jgi:thioredoxin-related protein